MIKKLIYFYTVLFFLGSSQVFSGIEFVPYYNYQFIEGISMSPEGKYGFLVNLSNDIGTIIKPFEKHSFIGFYSIKYQGPGLKKQEGREFSERYLDHLFVARHHWDLGGGIKLKNQLDIMMEARRSGANETWSNGLYNFNRYGGSSYLNKKFGDIDFDGFFKYHFMTFPNYTDLLDELQEGADPSASEGKQNSHIFEIGGQGSRGKNTVSISMIEQIYTQQKVVVEQVQEDGTYYSDKKQNDISFTLSGKRKEILSERSVVYPEVSFLYKNSNQNYQHFETVTDTVAVHYIENYYDYYDVALSVPVTLALSEKWSFIFSPEISYKAYLNREPRDESGNFLEGKKQSRVLGIYTAGFKNQIGESSSSMLFFTYQNQSSNMEYERYISYNYSGFSLGFKFQMEY